MHPIIPKLVTQISAVIITFNEERNLMRCLTSLQGIADEIVVVDSYSTDNTEAICKSFGVNFIQHVFEGYIEQKNWACNQSMHPFVLSLDADEALGEELKKSILAVKSNLNKDGYEMNRKTNYCGQFIQHSGWYPDKKLRLFDTRKGKWGGTNPHDKYEFNSELATVGFLKGDLLHYSYYTVEEHYKQTEKFAEIMAQALFKSGKKVSYLKLFLSPVTKFFQSYFLQLGFLDGYYGFVICRISAYATFLKYSKLRRLWQ